METVRARTPVDIAVMAPYLLGFHPEDSLVLLALDGRRVGLIQRCDIVPDEHAERAVRQMVGQVVQTRARAVVAVAYETRSGASARMRAVLAGLVDRGVIGCSPVVVVRDGRWHSPDRDVEGWEADGVVLPEASRVPGVAALVAHGRAPLRTRSDLADQVAPGTHPGSVLVETLLAHRPTGPQGRATATAAWTAVLRAREPVDDLDDDVVADLVVSLRDRAWRDALLAVLTPGPDAVPGIDPEDLRTAAAAARCCTWTHDATGSRGGEVDDAAALDVEALLDRLCGVVHRVPEPRSAPLLTVVGQVAWWSGSGALAGVALEAALRADPRYRLAVLLDQLVTHGIRLPAA